MVQPRREAVAKRIGGIIEALKPVKAGKHGMFFAESVIDSGVERVLVADDWCVREVIVDVAGALARLIGQRVKLENSQTNRVEIGGWDDIAGIGCANEARGSSRRTRVKPRCVGIVDHYQIAIHVLSLRKVALALQGGRNRS